MSTRSVVSSDPGSLSGLSSSAASTMGMVAANDVFRPTARYHYPTGTNTRDHDSSSSFAELQAALWYPRSSSTIADYRREQQCCPLCGYNNDSQHQQPPQYEWRSLTLTGEAASAAAMGACWVCISAVADAGTVEEEENNDHHHASFSTLDHFHDELHPGGDRRYFGYANPTTLDDATNHENHLTPAIATVYIGDYNGRGQRHGAHGELLWDNGDRYVGSFVNGQRTGSGTLFFRDGSIYTGDWLDNQMHGRGQRTFANGDVYVGSYRHGQRCGGPDCKFKFANGDLYVGHWESNDFHGPGRYFFADGTALEGHFVHGKKQGKFKRQKANGTLDILRYENDQVSGQGVRWNATRTKTWLLKTVVDKRQVTTHRRMLSDDALQQPRNRRKQHERSLSSSNVANDDLDEATREALAAATSTFPSEYDIEPPVEVQVMTMTKKSSRIPIAQAVSIGYDCELGVASRDTNPAFWSIGDFNNEGNPNDSSRNLV